MLGAPRRLLDRETSVRIGIAIGGRLDQIGSVARRCEEAGFDSLWLAEAGRTAFIQAAAAAQATERIRIGTSIALAFPRSPRPGIERPGTGG